MTTEEVNTVPESVETTDANTIATDNDAARMIKATEKLEAVNSDIQNFSRSSLYSVPLVVHVVIGTTRMPLADIMTLGVGSIIELDQKVGESVNIVVNDKIIAKGQLVVDDEDDPKLGVTITGLLKDVS